MKAKTVSYAALLLMLTQAQAQDALAPGLTPSKYFDCQLAARQATLQGLQERQALVNKDASKEQKNAAGEMNRQRVGLAFYQCGYSAAQLGAYAHRNAEELQTWLNVNPQTKATLDEQARRVSGYSAQMPAVSPSAKR
jgi:hypothetical protein